MHRRNFIKNNLTAGSGLILGPTLAFGKAAPPVKQARIGCIGVGLRGTTHLKNLLKRKDVVIPAICDIDPERIKIALDLISKAGFKKPETYTNGEEAFREMVKRDDLDGVIIATPWAWHTPMAVAAMRAGKWPGIEVSAAQTLEECWDLVNTSEATGVPCMILENSCYRRDVMAVLNMVRQGVFGELTHCRCGYLHDLREIKFQPGVEFGEKGISEARWRTNYSVHQNGDVYPTHGIGPIANILNINRGNRFVSLTSMASKSRSLHQFIVDKGGKDHPNAQIQFKLGDVVTTSIQTANGETIVVTLDTNSPRPKQDDYHVQGTKGLWMHNTNSIYIDGKSKEHQADPADKYLADYDATIWKRDADKSVGSGHPGGNDYFVLNSFVESVKRRIPFLIDVYDAAAWSAITPLSEMSIAAGGAPQQFPDFTRGNWLNRKPVFGLNNEY